MSSIFALGAASIAFDAFEDLFEEKSRPACAPAGTEQDDRYAHPIASQDTGQPDALHDAADMADGAIADVTRL